MSTKKRLLLTKNELAELLGCSVRTLNRKIADGAIDRGELPKRFSDTPSRWLTETVKQWMESRAGESIDLGTEQVSK